MKFSFNEFHLWHQLGLSLMAAGKVSSSLLITNDSLLLQRHATPEGDIHLLPFLRPVPLSSPSRTTSRVDGAVCWDVPMASTIAE